MASLDKVECVHCGKMISKKNISTHRKKFHSQNDKPLYADLEEAVRVAQQDIVTKDLTIMTHDRQLALAKQVLTKKNEEINRYKTEIARLTTLVEAAPSISSTHNNTTNNDNSNNNINVNITNNNTYYIIDTNGIRDGLDMSKLRNFGEENVDYVDPTQPLPKILKDIYCNPDHMENKVIGHEYLNLQWILFKCKDHVLRLYLERDRGNVRDLVDVVCDNVQRLLGKKFDNDGERNDAVVQLLAELDGDIKKMMTEVGVAEANKRMPLWNRKQYEKLEGRRWEKYMSEPSYSQKELNIEKWIEYGY